MVEVIVKCCDIISRFILRLYIYTRKEEEEKNRKALAFVLFRR